MVFCDINCYRYIKINTNPFFFNKDIHYNNNLVYFIN